LSAQKVSETVAQLRSQTRRLTSLKILEWLVGDECHELDDAKFAAGLRHHLRAARLPVDRLVLHLRTLDPEIRFRTVAWAPDEPVEIRDRPHGIALVPGFADSPARRAVETQAPVILRVDHGTDVSWIPTDLFEGRPQKSTIFIEPAVHKGRFGFGISQQKNSESASRSRRDRATEIQFMNFAPAAQLSPCWVPSNLDPSARRLDRCPYPGFRGDRSGAEGCSCPAILKWP
jgi:hypothetical protein